MKVKILFMAFVIMPFLTFSQQLEEKNMTIKKEKNEKVVKIYDLNESQYQPSGSHKMIQPLSETERIKYSIPEDFPRISNTGNKRLDEDNYYKAQQNWIKINPKRFEEIKQHSF